MDSPPSLIVVCGLPGAGKITRGKALAEEVGAIRLSPDEWMETLSLSLWDEESRGRIEALQWDLSKDLLRLGQTVTIEWGTWDRPPVLDRDDLYLRPPLSAFVGWRRR